MALPSFSQIWSSRQSDVSSSNDEKFYLLGRSSSEKNQLHPVFRRNTNVQWFDQSYSISPYSCCDRPFDTKEQLQEHKNNHVKCFTPDCEFSAHPDVVEKHFELQHHNNLYRKVCLTNRPEDISKWISDRKRNFPTKARAELKQKEEEKRRDRGLVIEKKEFSSMRGGRGHRHQRDESSRHFPRQRGRDRGGMRRGRGRGGMPRGRGRGEMFSGRGRGGETTRGRGLFRGFSRGGRRLMEWERQPVADPLSSLETAEGDEEEDEDERPVEISSKRPPPSLPPEFVPDEAKQGGLSLIADYDSDEDEETETPEGSETNGIPSVKEDEIRNEAQIEKSDPRPPPESLSERDFRRRDPVLRLIRRREICMEDKRRILTRPRLLEMLLARDIQHERNVLMQCCYFIVKRNFFGRRPLQAMEISRPTSIVVGTPTSNLIPKVNEDEDWDGDDVL